MTIPSSSPDPRVMSLEEALELPPDGRRAYFGAVRLMHPRIGQVMEDLDVLLQPDAGSDLTLLIGPTGVGKSTIVQSLSEKILKRHATEMADDPGFIPVVKVEAPASGERGFSWRIFYQRLGEALQEPLMGRKQETVCRDGRIMVRPVSTGSSVAALRLAVENALTHRRTSLVIVDEAVHLLRNLQGNTLENHMDALKSLANICGVKLLLVGSYDLHGLMRLSAQVARRSTIVHFQRYLVGREADEHAFREVLTRFGSYLPLEGDIELEAYAQALQKACIGCVGILKDTLSRALSMALNADGKWSQTHLERAILSPNQLTSVLEETLQGESKILRTTFGTGSLKAAIQRTREVEFQAAGVA